MTKSFRGFMKGIGVGVTLGCVAGSTGYCYVRRNKRGVKRNVGKILKTLGSLVESITGMF
ncbi:MAG: hypothetical protein FWE80_02005 [Oscillospiraceae bacterium]|nr:hypothetical protein [Oscillospiraceae bacterium]